MNAALVESLYLAAVYTFEQLTFLLPDIPPDELQRRRTVSAVASVAFSGPSRGVLQVHAGEGLLPRLTANMMGTETASELLQLDALGEIANIICGQVLPTLHPVGAFEQQPPEVVACAGDGAPPLAAPCARVQLGLETSRMDLLLFLHPDSSLRSTS
jgi:CheY-specific phosphatase CheX